jgi:hypothetical protein
LDITIIASDTTLIKRKQQKPSILTRLAMSVRQLPPLPEQRLPQSPQQPPQISDILTSCFGQMPQIPKCGTVRDFPMEDRPPTGRDRRGAAPVAEQTLALRDIEIEVRKHVTTAMKFSLIIGDDETQWSELGLQKSGDESCTYNSYTRASGSCTDDDTYTQGDTTHANTITMNENNKPHAEESNPNDGIPVVKSFRDRFHYMSNHKKFTNAVADDPPSNTHEAMNMGGRPNLATLRTSAFPNTQSKGNQSPKSASGANNMSAQKKLKRQNELAKQIMQRRANAASNRKTLEPKDFG